MKYKHFSLNQLQDLTGTIAAQKSTLQELIKSLQDFLLNQLLELTGTITAQKSTLQVLKKVCSKWHPKFGLIQSNRCPDFGHELNFVS